MINPEQLLEHIIYPTIKTLGLDEGQEKAVGWLILSTFYIESDLKYIRQIGGGPALSLGQIEPNTYNDCIKNYLSFRPELMRKVIKSSYCDSMPKAEALLGNIYLSVSMARIVYRRCPAPIPELGNLEQFWHIYKTYYNTAGGASTKDKSIQKAREMFGYFI